MLKVPSLSLLLDLFQFFDSAGIGGKAINIILFRQIGVDFRWNSRVARQVPILASDLTSTTTSFPAPIPRDHRGVRTAKDNV